MRRREFISLVGGAATWPFSANAQHRERLHRIGVLHGLAETDPEGLRENGWVVGRNISIEYRWAADAAQARAYASKLVGEGPEVILGHSTPVVAALSQETTSIPIVFVVVIDPVGGGLVHSLARPGKNITGFTNYEMTIGGKWLEILREMSPGIKRIALLFNPDTAPFSEFFLKSLTDAANTVNIEPLALRARDAAGMASAMDSFAAASSAAMIVVPDITTVRNRRLIIDLAFRHRLPTIYPFRYFANDGGLVYYGMDVLEHYRGAAGYIGRILHGANPAELPVQAPTKYELIINLKTAKALGLEVPPTLLARADEVIE
jgi:ABC-type uncharacterized transport system substrate-binding protein